ncbi:MAG: DUF4239 domain-containing protein [Candidatus Saganbacteria bacterium]|nr:DUF4239 domain-containing protein [Candidatus Saganbacteria bacterium]
MPLIQSILLNVPTVVIGMVIILGFVGLSIAGVFLVRKFVPHNTLKLHNDVAGFIFSTIGVIYAVLLAFMVIVTWQSFDQANTNVTREANCLGALYRDSVAFSPAFQRELHSTLDSYVDAIIKEEWPLLARGERSEHVQELSNHLWQIYGSYQPKTDTEKLFFAETLRKKNEASELRRLRIYDSRVGIHPILWFVLVAGGIITILFPLFLGTENFLPQLIMVSLLAALIGLILFTIMAMEYPFSGSVCVTPDAFKVILQDLAKL